MHRGVEQALPFQVTGFHKVILIWSPGLNLPPGLAVPASESAQHDLLVGPTHDVHRDVIANVARVPSGAGVVVDLQISRGSLVWLIAPIRSL